MGDPLSEFRESGAIRQGHFRLTSGLHSDTYLQCALVLADPARAARLLTPLARQWASAGVTVVAGPAVGGILVAYELARLLKARAIYSEREEGAMRLRRGFTLTSKDTVLLAEDVITTGGSLMEIRRLAEDAGALVVGVASLVDRTDNPGVIDLPFHSALKLAPPTYPPEACPLCTNKIPIDAPGSRHLSTPKKT